MGFLEENDFSNVPCIPEFYKNKTILITGGSGFMGKVLIEKLLYSCPELDRIYLIIRTKKGAKSDDRISTLYSSQCFDRLRTEKPGMFESKVFVIAGDMTEIGLGLSQEDRALLVNRVNVIFHVAASVRFDDSLTYATKLNLRGTREIVELAKEVRELNAFVHISTCYSNTNRNPIEEKMYPPHADWRDTIEICEKIDEDILKIFTHKYLGDIPNTYTFTKQLAESVVFEQKGILPIVMVRPSIVISSIEEPCVGWIENFNGPVGILIACGKGLLRSVYTDPDLIADYIPVDSAIRNIIAAGWVRGVKKVQPTDEMPIFNCCAGTLNHMTMYEIMVTGKEIQYENPLQGQLWPVNGSITKSKMVHYIEVLLFHLLPALFVDAVLLLVGRKPMLVKIQRKIYVANLALGYYITRQWTFINENFVKLRKIIKESDSDKFNYYVENMDKKEYFKKAFQGARWYLLKEKDEDLPKARIHQTRMYFLDKTIKAITLTYITSIFVHSKYYETLKEYVGY